MLGPQARQRVLRSTTSLSRASSSSSAARPKHVDLNGSRLPAANEPTQAGSSEPWKTLKEDPSFFTSIPARNLRQSLPRGFFSQPPPGSRRSISTTVQPPLANIGPWASGRTNHAPGDLGTKNPDAKALWRGTLTGLNFQRSPTRSDVEKPFKPRRQTMTARELSAFDDMFANIFRAVDQQRQQLAEEPSASAHAMEKQADPAIEALFGNLRLKSKNQRWTPAVDEYLDRKKEEMELITTDHELLQWATKNVFTDVWEKDENADIPAEALSAYPHLVTLLMKHFRERYRDPHLALAVFDIVRYASIRSFVYGCSTAAYNELIETRWMAFRDLRGVLNALEEMQVNHVECDSGTRKLVERIRRQIGEGILGKKKGAQVRQQQTSGGVMEILNKIESLVAIDPDSMDVAEPGRWTESSQTWKFRDDLLEAAQDSLSFAEPLETPTHNPESVLQPLP